MTDDPIPYPPGTRPFTPADARAVLALALEWLDSGELQGVSRYDLEYTNRRLIGDPSLAAVAVEGDEVVGVVVPRHDELIVRRSARRRGHATRLLVPGRAIARRHGYPWLRVMVPLDPASEGRAFATARGFTYDSSMWSMRLPAGHPVPTPKFPADLIVRWLELDRDEEAYVELVNEAFLDHPSPLRVSVAEIRNVHAQAGFDPRMVLLLAAPRDPGRLLGFARVDRYTDDAGTAIGEVRLIGVRPEARGRGLGRELLRWGITEVRQRGASHVILSVEGANDRALGLYLREGFTTETEWPHWTLPLDP